MQDNGQPLISVDELQSLTSPTVIIDCRFDLMNPDAGRSAWEQGHIPDAHYLDLNRDLSVPIAKHGGRHPLPDLDAFTTRLRECGVNDDTLIVAYDSNRNAFAARLWFLCLQIGHTRIQVLNGGLNAWLDAGLPLSTEPPHNQPGNLQRRTVPNIIVDYDHAKAISQGQIASEVLVDSRETPRYLGEIEPIDPIAGHIPGALNLPWITAVDERGYFLPVEAQAQRWNALALNGRKPVIYCGSGVTACVNLMSLALAGTSDHALYAGSWSDWCSYQG